MDRFLPWIAIAAGILSLVLASTKTSKSVENPTVAFPACVVAVALVYAAALGFRSALPGLADVAHGIALGSAVVVLAAYMEHRTGRSGLVAIGIATLAAGFVLLMPAEIRQSMWLGAALGSGIAAACASLAPGSLGSERLTAFMVAAFAGACVLGSYREGVDRAAAVPALIGVIAVIALSVVRFGSMSKWIKWSIVAIVLVGGAKLIAMRYLFLGASFNVALGAVASAAVVAWILENEDNRSHGSFAICMLVWLAWSTVAFGLLQGLGLAITVVYAAAFLVAAGSYRGLLSMASLVALLFYRLFLEMYPNEARQIDVGQQYAVMGIVAGAVLPVAVGTWLARAGTRFTGMAKPLIALLVGTITVALLIAADFVLGSKGTVGVLIGLALAPFVAGLTGGDRLGVLAAIGGLAAAVVVTFKFVSPHLLLERAEKIQVLGWTIGIAVMLIGLAHWLTKETLGVTPNESVA